MGVPGGGMVSIGVGGRGWAGQLPRARERCRWGRGAGQFLLPAAGRTRAAEVREEAREQGAEQEPEAHAFFPAWPVLTLRPLPGKRSRSSLRFWKPVGWQVAQLQEASLDVEALAENR